MFCFLILLFFFYLGEKPGNNNTNDTTPDLKDGATTAVEDFIRYSARGEWDKAMVNLSGEALERVKVRHTKAQKVRILDLDLFVKTANSRYAEVEAEISLKLPDGTVSRQSYLYRLCRLNGTWKIFEQLTNQPNYGPEPEVGTVSPEQKEIIKQYLQLSASGKWGEAAKYATGKNSIDTVDTGGTTITDLQLQPVAAKDALSLVEARYKVQKPGEMLREMRVLFELAKIDGDWKITRTALVWRE
ncbi:MAG: hypothetical protein H0Z39_07005 [Peptococcaceae bacterium]|nr:hypothetical protein [Peptococcaceae bacterium]